MATTSIATPVKRKYGVAAIGTDGEDEIILSSKKAKLSTASQDTSVDGPVKSADKTQLSPLKKIESDNSAATFPLADSGYDVSVTNTPGSNKPCAFVQPGSSGYISGSDCGTQRTPGQFSPDFVFQKKKVIGPFSSLSLKSFLQENFAVIKEELLPTGVADRLYTDGIISNRDIEKINEERFRVDKCDILIKAIARFTTTSDIHTTRKVIEAFSDEGYEYLFNEFAKEKVKTPKKHTPAFITKDEIRRRFCMNSSYIEDEIDPLLIIDDLVVEDVLTFDEHEDIRNMQFKPKKVKYLIKYILRKPEQVFWTFCKVLEKHYQPLADRLLQGSQAVLDHDMTSVLDVTLVKKPAEIFTGTDYQRTIATGCDTWVTFTFHGDGKDEEQMIVEDNTPDINNDLQEEAMEIGGFQIWDVQFSCIRINLTSMSRQSQMVFLKKCRESPMFLEKWLQNLIKERHIQSLKEKNIDTILFKINMCIPKLEESKCFCKLTKEIIVQHYTSIEKDLHSVDKILKTFGTFEGFDDTTKDVFKQMYQSLNENKVEAFLRTLLDLSDSGVHLCLLEREMRTTNPELLKRITSNPLMEKEIKLSPKDIRHNMNFLLGELEPRQFIDMLTGITESEHVIEKIMSTDRRRERCKILLKFIIHKGNCAVERFISELERNDQWHVLDYLMTSGKHEESVILKEALVSNYGMLVDEIEPRTLRQIFVERREIKAKKIDLICKLSTRRNRAIALLKHVLNGTNSIWKCFLDAMEVSRYKHIVTTIHGSIDTSKDCPRLYQSEFVGNRSISIEGEFRLEYKQGDVKESLLQLFLHSLIYVGNIQTEEIANRTDEAEQSDSKEFDAKRTRTRTWIKQQQLDRKRERNELDTTEDIPESKRICREISLPILLDDSVSSSPTFGWNSMLRQDDLLDYCSSPPLTRSLSSGSNDKPVYEDISPPSSPNPDNIDKPHTIIRAPCSALSMAHSRTPLWRCADINSVPAKYDSICSMASMVYSNINDYIESCITTLLKGSSKTHTNTHE